MTITTGVIREITCKVCQAPHLIHGSFSQWERYDKGQGFIQDIFPEKSADDRELLVSGICGNCFDKIFGGEEE